MSRGYGDVFSMRRDVSLEYDFVDECLEKDVVFRCRGASDR